MFFQNNQRLRFVRFTAVLASMYLYISLYQNKVYAESLGTAGNSGNTKYQGDPCDQTCEKTICHIEANELKLIMDESIDPCDDFYHFACGQFIKMHNISDESSSINRFSLWENDTYDDVRSAIQQVNASFGKPFTMLKNYYQSCLNQENDIGSVLKIFDIVGGFPLLLGNNWTQANYSWEKSLFNAVVNENFQTSFPVFLTQYNEETHSTRNIVKVMRVRRDIDSSLDKTELLKYYQYVVESIEILAQSKNISKKDILDMVKFEIKLNTILASYEQFTNQNIYQLDCINIIDEPFINKLHNFITETPKRIVANYIAWDILKIVYEYLPKEFDHIKEKYDLNAFDTREQFCINELKNSFTVSLDALYVRKYIAPYFHKEVNEDVKNLVQNVKKQFEANIEKAEWVDRETRAFALKKINNMRTLVNYAEELMNDTKIEEYYREVNLKTKSFFTSSIALKFFKLKNYYATLRYPYKRMDWTTKLTATTVNAKYDDNENLIEVPAAFLQQFIYTYSRPQYLNYGALGTIVGHEITHSFDSTGRKFDEDGNFNDRWDESSEKIYLQKVQCFVDQYNNFSFPRTNLTVNGTKTQNENIADNEGLKAAYYAYNKWAEVNGITEQCLPGLHYTPKQMFWISSATTWCSKYGIEFLENCIDSDDHAPDSARVMLSFANMKEFAEDFKCKAGSRMNPIKKCTLW